MQSREQHIFSGSYLTGNHHFLRVKQVYCDGNGFSEGITDLFYHFCRESIPLVSGTADGADGAVIRRQFTLKSLSQLVFYPGFNGGIRRDCFQTAEVSAVAAFAERIYLNMADFAEITTPVQQDLIVDNDPRPGPGEYAPAGNPRNRAWRRNSVRPARGCGYHGRHSTAV